MYPLLKNTNKSRNGGDYFEELKFTFKILKQSHIFGQNYRYLRAKGLKSNFMTLITDKIDI